MEYPAGYMFAASKYQPPLGHSRLDVYLSSQQLSRSFDAKKARFLVFRQGSIRELLVVHPWISFEGEQTIQVCPGRFKLSEYDEDVHYGFTWGGKLAITNENELTHCVLTSSAPILNLESDPHMAGSLIANEIEMLMAERQAAWGLDENGFAERLAGVEPLALFASMLASINRQQNEIPAAARGSDYLLLEHNLHAMMKILEQAGDWPAHVPLIEELI
jgi:hypothetical protein